MSSELEVDEIMGTLSQAEAAGRVLHIVDEAGKTTSHLLTCKANPVTRRTEYDPNTIARDILRAEADHPYLPALNKRFVKKAQREEEEYWRRYDVYSQACRSRQTREEFLDWDPLEFGDQ